MNCYTTFQTIQYWSCTRTYRLLLKVIPSISKTYTVPSGLTILWDGMCTVGNPDQTPTLFPKLAFSSFINMRPQNTRQLPLQTSFSISTVTFPLPRGHRLLCIHWSHTTVLTCGAPLPQYPSRLICSPAGCPLSSSLKSEVRLCIICLN